MTFGECPMRGDSPESLAQRAPQIEIQQHLSPIRDPPTGFRDEQCTRCAILVNKNIYRRRVRAF